jgi:hypothetical protein
MTEVPKIVPGASPNIAMPKIVYDRVGAASLPPNARNAIRNAINNQAHPDADLLTAFAEQVLPGSERNAMLVHLALCGDCRHVLALALPNMEDAAAAVTTREEFLRKQASAFTRLSFARPALRWTALAAGVVLAGAVLLVRPGPLNQLKLPSTNQQAATTAASSSSGAQIASSSVPTSAEKTGIPPPAVNSTAAAGTETARKKSEKTAGQAATQPSVAQNTPHQHRTETGEVSGSSDKVSAEDTLMAASRAPVEEDKARAIERAKPASPEMEPSELQDSTQEAQPLVGLQGRMSTSPRVTWSIASGDLQRSLDGGQTWQSAFHADHPLLCYANLGTELWTGGQTGTLFHSLDGGITWMQVLPSFKGQPLSSNITHIDIRSGDNNSPEAITLSTSNDSDVWSSTDGGKTWQNN